MTVLPELHALVTAHERLAQALLRGLARADPARAARVATELQAVAGEASADEGESSDHLARVLEDYALLLLGSDAGTAPGARQSEST